VSRAIAPRYPSRSWFKNGEGGALERAPRHQADRHPGDWVGLRRENVRRLKNLSCIIQ
jgi:hypothetical protein